MHYLYILYNQLIDKYYTGITANLDSRLAEHNNKRLTGRYTNRQRGLWELVYAEKYITIEEARRRELYVKRRKSRKYIESIISS